MLRSKRRKHPRVKIWDPLRIHGPSRPCGVQTRTSTPIMARPCPVSCLSVRLVGVMQGAQGRRVDSQSSRDHVQPLEHWRPESRHSTVRRAGHLQGQPARSSSPHDRKHHLLSFADSESFSGHLGRDERCVTGREQLVSNQGAPGPVMRGREFSHIAVSGGETTPVTGRLSLKRCTWHPGGR